MISNVLVIFVNVGINIWLTRYFIDKLGVEVYGMIPMAMSFISYFNVFTMSISNAVSRFVTIHLNKDDAKQANVYFNTAWKALLFVCGILMIPVIILSLFFSRLFQVPYGFEKETSILFLMVIMSSFILSVNSVFLVSTFVRHRFDLNNSIRVLSKIFQFCILILCFHYLSPSLKYFGISEIGMALFTLTGALILMRCLTPQLHVKWGIFDWLAFREMGHMGVWMIVREAGTFFYFSANFIVINIILGPEDVGYYAPIAQWVPMLFLLAGIISRVFVPIIYEYIAHNELDNLSFQLRRCIRFMGLMMAFCIGMMCGLANPILEIWLGSSFAALSPLVWLLIGPFIIIITAVPIESVFRGMNKVKIPAIVTFSMGVVHLLISIILVQYTNLGIYAVALSLAVCMGARDLFFAPIYAATIINQPKMTFLRENILGVILFTVISLTALVLSKIFNLAFIPRLLTVCVSGLVIYVALCYFVIINQKDKVFVKSLILRSAKLTG
ncbi:MAG: hypothetical protein M0P14_01810 [Alkaliphilus sp.]|nr:hypothetical protein [Alkaliphilus sp.]